MVHIGAPNFGAFTRLTASAGGEAVKADKVRLKSRPTGWLRDVGVDVDAPNEAPGIVGALNVKTELLAFVEPNWNVPSELDGAPNAVPLLVELVGAVIVNPFVSLAFSELNALASSKTAASREF